MSSARIARRVTPAGLVRAGRHARFEDAEPRLSNAPLSDPADILRRMPAQALSPALLVLLDVMASPILLIKNNPAGEFREIAAA